MPETIVMIAPATEAAAPAPPPPVPVPSVRRQDLQGTAPAAPTPPGAPTYLATSDVDQPAAPTEDWQIDTSRLPVGVIYRAVLNVWVDATGTVRNVEVLELSPDDALARGALQKLWGTQMSPALLQSRPVANVRHLEIGFGQE